MHESRKHSTHHCDQMQHRTPARGPTFHLAIRSHRELPEQRNQYPSENALRAGAVHLPSGIQFAGFVNATDGNQQLQLGTAFPNWTHWCLPRQQERPMKAHDRLFEARNSILLAKQPSSHRAKGPTSAALTKRHVEGFPSCIFHQSADSRDHLGVRMLKGCHWLPSVVLYSWYSFFERESCRIYAIGFEQVSRCFTVEALPVVELVDQELGQPQGTSASGHGFQPRNQPGTLAYCHHAFYTASQPAADVLPKSLSIWRQQSIRRFLGSERLGWLRLQTVFQLLPGSSISLRLMLAAPSPAWCGR
ncbi:hypothetical protein HPB50_008213 [Hyalomma asiaticum]|uniref:Uncharacterized protein n=1 Tax=Hyalomma asiaticum TaxID=266040 RepID=A0ACB7TEF6_HYAAI|nr:hypothetical protein HPB50_008213 [Hyalomma asiaticum]